MKIPNTFAKDEATPYKANKWRVAYVLLMSIYLMLAASLSILWHAMFGRCSRAKADHILRHWAVRLLRLPHIQYQLNQHYPLNFSENKPYMLMSNHSSLYDIPLIIATIPDSVRMLAKKEMMRIPFVAGAMLATEFLFVDRKNREQAREDLARCKSKMANGIRLWVAPEGTRSRDGRLQAFKKGVFITAIETNATIIPIGINGAHETLPSKTLNLTMNKQIYVNIGQAINAADYQVDNKEALMADVHRKIEQLMQLP